MSETIISKTCSRCNQEKDATQFYPQQTTADGYRAWCKQCDSDYAASLHGKQDRHKYKHSPKGKVVRRRHQQSDKGKATHRKYRQTYKGKAAMSRAVNKYRLRFPDKYLAGKRLNHVIKKGNFPYISTQICSCGQQAEHYHHPNGYDEDQSLNVIPLCAGCHRNIHKEMSEALK